MKLKISEMEWDEFRIESSVKFLCAILRRGDDEIYPDPEEVCSIAVLYADTLIETLKDE